ncbi:MAG: AmmeMemoRadiSam system protein B [Candidatus Aminicenantes bacterium]|nr:AmmeMemoRadiSam system protein B [Candidatus Aminicenantes bacterium]
MEKKMARGESIPPIREDLEVLATSYQGQKALLIRDFLGLIRDPVILQGDALDIVGLIDGTRTVRDIQVELVRLKNGLLVDAASIGLLIRRLDEALLLQSERYFSRKENFLTDYLRQEVRTPSQSGQAYPDRPEALRAFIDDIIEPPAPEEDLFPGKSIIGLVAPHIDLGVGKKVYAGAYRSIRSLRPRRVLLLGTGHGLTDAYFSLTEKDYETPFGRAATDREAVRRLMESGRKAVSPYDIHHRAEHSIEFQVVFLQRLFGTSFTVVPILCGSFVRELARVSRPSEVPGVDGFLAALKALREEDPAGTLVVAGVDFSHIGPKFGHRERASSLLLEAEAHDRDLIAALAAGDVSGFWEESRKVGDRYNVCGFSTLAVVLEAFPGIRGRLLDYAFWREESTRSAVSYAAIILAAEH